MAQALAAEHPDLHIQTHLSENRDEIDFTLSLYPEARDYLDVYETYGLLGPKSLFGHAIHLSDARDRRDGRHRLGRRLLPDLEPLPRLRASTTRSASASKGVRRAIATDVGGGTNYSMLRTLDEGYKVLALRGQKLNPLTAFWWITRGNAEALGLADTIGTLAPGTEADIVALDARATPAMALRAETIETLAEELFLLETLGDDRADRRDLRRRRALAAQGRLTATETPATADARAAVRRACPFRVEAGGTCAARDLPRFPEAVSAVPRR